MAQEKDMKEMFDRLEGSEKMEMPDFLRSKIKDAVFSTIDATSLIADIMDLFSLKFVAAQAEILDSLPSADYGINEEDKLFQYQLQQRKNKEE